MATVAGGTPPAASSLPSARNCPQYAVWRKRVKLRVALPVEASYSCTPRELVEQNEARPAVTLACPLKLPAVIGPAACEMMGWRKRFQ